MRKIPSRKEEKSARKVGRQRRKFLVASLLPILLSTVKFVDFGCDKLRRAGSRGPTVIYSTKTSVICDTTLEGMESTVMSTRNNLATILHNLSEAYLSHAPYIRNPRPLDRNFLFFFEFFVF